MAKIDRRAFLKASAMTAVGVVAAACARPTPQVIEKEVPVEKVVKETVIVEKQVPVEKVVKETVVVEKQVAVEKVVTATPVPKKYKEAPMLEALVKAGKLPPVEQRLPEDPYIAKPTELWGWKGTIGKYGGTWRMASKGPGDDAWWQRVVEAPKVLMWGPDFSKAEVLPALASRWEVSPDGRSFTFHLRKGLKWSDGAPLTTENIKWYYDNVMLNKDLTPGLPAAYLRQGENIAELKVTDAFTFTWTFKDPNGFFLWNLCMPRNHTFVCPSHYMQQFHANFVPKDQLDKLVKEAKYENWVQLYQARDSYFNSTSEAPNWMPWMMTVRVGAGAQIVWERNPYFWMVDTEGQQLPYIDKLVAKVHQSLDTMVLDAIAGEVDCQSRHISQTANIPVFQQNMEKGGYHFTYQTAPDGPTQVAFCLSMTTKDPVKRELFRNKNFRLALSHAIDREELWGLVFRGAATFEGPKWDSPLQQDEEDEIYRQAAVYDPDKANKMLDELGLTKRDSEGFRLMKDGRRLSILMEGAVDYKEKAQAMEIIAEHWKKVGVEGIVKIWDRPLFQQKRQNDECELCSHGDPGRGASWTVGLMVDARMDVPVHWEADYGHMWYTWYATAGKEGEEPPEDVKQALALYDQVKATPDFKKQVELYKQIRMIRAKGFWWIDLGPYWIESSTFCVTKNDMQNVPPRMPSDWNWLTPGPSQTWMYYFDPPRKS